MKPAAFRYHQPRTLEEALDLLAKHGEAARPIAGGQSLVPMMNLRMAQPAELVDLCALEGLRTLREVDGWLEIGAMVRHHDIETSPLVAVRCPLLAQVAGTIGHYAIRQRGTMGGSLAHADPAAQWPLLALTLQAELNLVGPRGRRRVAARDFNLGLMTTALQADELLESVRFPVCAPGEGGGFQCFARRAGDFAIVAAAVSLRIERGAVSRLRLGLGGVAPVPQDLDDLARAQLGCRVDAAWAAHVGAQARDAVDVPEDARIPAVYRKELIETMVTRALNDAIAHTGKS